MSVVRSPQVAAGPKGQTPRSKSSNSLLDDAAKQVSLPELKNNQPMVEKSKPLPTSLQSDFLPDDVLLALTQPAPPADKLGPLHRQRNINVSDAYGRKPPSNVWNYPKARERLGHLAKAPPCLCGAGQDISFLYDVPKKETEPPKLNKRDPSFIRTTEQQEQKQGLKLPDTLIPDEYHIVKSKGVLGLEYHTDKYGTQPVDHEAHLVMFPSMNPTSRYEVIKLRKALSEMLSVVGMDDLESGLDGPTQMHNLLEIIKKEQNIYNMIFHELIRQVSIECVERGELLSALRDRYSELFSKVPKQIQGLHEEVLAQRALDRRLTEELMRFKSTIGVLTSELTNVKEHDQEVTFQAKQAKDDLKVALGESQKNASLLSEYHSLYELQRKRLEKQVTMLANEKEIWSSAAYSLALKVIEEHSLNSCKRLHISEKGWLKLANHFTILLSDKDTELLTKLQSYVDKWHNIIEEFNQSILGREDGMRDQLNSMKSDFQRWKTDLTMKLMSAEGHLVRHPDQESLQYLHKDMKKWEECLGHESEKFGGDILLSGQETLQEIGRLVDGWTDCSLKVFNRHRGDQGENHPDQDEMLRLNEEIAVLVRQYHVRLTGENGVATGLIHISNALETWASKVALLTTGGNPLQDQDWLRFFQCLDDWSSYVDESVVLIGSTQKEDEKSEDHQTVEVQKVMRSCQKWLASTTNGIDNEDAKLVEQTSTLHTDSVKWMVQMLLRLAPDQKEHSKEAKEAVLLGSATVGQLQSNAKTLFEQMSSFTNHVTVCCSGIVNESMQRKIDAHEDDPQHELKELMLFKSECDDWIRTAKIMVCELTGEEYVEPVAPLVTERTKSSLMSSPEDVKEGEKTETKEGEELKEDAEGEEREEKKENEEKETVKEETEEKQEEIQQKKEQATELEPEAEEKKEEDKEDKQEEKADKEETKEGETKEEGDVLQYLGHDANTHTHQLEQDPNKAPHEMPERDQAANVQTPNTKNAYEALAAVTTLQEELIATEARAQREEERALGLEAELTAEKEKVRELERVIAGLKQDSEEKKPQKSNISDRPSVNLPGSAKRGSISPTKTDGTKSPSKSARSSASSSKGKKK